MYKAEVITMKKQILKIPTLTFNSEFFKCEKCGYAERRLILGDISHTPCPQCGHSPMKRV